MISIFHRRDVNFFIAVISIFSSLRYRFFHRHDIDFFITATSIFLRRDIDFFAPSRRYSFGLTVAPPSGAVLQFLCRRALCDNHRTPTGAVLQFLRRRARSSIIIARRRALFKNFCADRRCSSIFAPTGGICNHYHSALTGAALQFLCRRALNSSIAPPSGVTFKHCASVGRKF